MDYKRPCHGIPLKDSTTHCRERYLEHKLTVLAKEAKEKLAKGDKKGT
jgi:hypothetical protein